MNRRSFVAAGASAFSLTAVAPLMQRTQWGRGERVELAGVLEPAPGGPGHFLVFRSETALGRDPLTGTEGMRAVVFPADPKAMRTGRVVLKGRLFSGKFADQPTGHTASTVLTEVTLA